MPKLTKEQLNQIKYVSIDDYLEKVNDFETISDKMKFTVRYLLNHKLEKEDFSFEESIQIARREIGAYLEKSNDKENLDANMFVANPVEYIRREAAKLSSAIFSEKIKTKQQEELEERCKKIAYYRSKGTMVQEIGDLNRDKLFPIKVQFVKEIGGKKALDNTLDDTKPGFFSRLFHTTSNEWKELEATYKDLSKIHNNVNKDGLKNAAIAYLRHKFRDFDESKEISPEMINKLDKTAKARTTFAYNIIKAIKRQDEIDISYNESLRKATDKNVEYYLIEESRKNKVIDLDQVEFQKNLGNETENKSNQIISNENLANSKEIDVNNLKEDSNEIE